MLDENFLRNNGVNLEESLNLFGDMGTYNDTVGEFLIGSNEKLKKLEDNKNRCDMANYAIYVHSLKSDAKYFGFTNLAEIAYNHEIKSKASDTYYINEHFNELVNEVNRMIHVVKQYLGKEPLDTNPVIEQQTAMQEAVEKYTRKTILVVDDSNIVRNFVKRIFENSYQVGTAKDGQEAIDIIKANQDNNMIVGILLDLNMPRVDGFKVLDYMRLNNLFTSMPVSIISGDSSKDTIEKAFTYQIVDMLRKPFGENDVKSVVEKTIYFREINN